MPVFFITIPYTAKATAVRLFKLVPPSTTHPSDCMYPFGSWPPSGSGCPYGSPGPCPSQGVLFEESVTVGTVFMISADGNAKDNAKGNDNGHDNGNGCWFVSLSVSVCVYVYYVYMCVYLRSRSVACSHLATPLTTIALFAQLADEAAFVRSQPLAKGWRECGEAAE